MEEEMREFLKKNLRVRVELSEFSGTYGEGGGGIRVKMEILLDDEVVSSSVDSLCLTPSWP